MRKIILLSCLIAGPTVFACVFCNPEVRAGIHDSTFYPNLLKIFSAFIVLAVVVGLLVFIAIKNFAKYTHLNSSTIIASPVPLIAASMVLGIGLGGFIDGIVFHQILQWHEMLSNVIPATDYIGKSINMFWDGIFHAFCLIIVTIGIVLLWKIMRKRTADTSGKLLIGGLLSGWALFNIIEGLINHHLLQLHNVMEFSLEPHIGNWIFLGSSIILLVVGYIVIKSANKLRIN
ncbi:MAG TPA: DUF2243 domain-containing protein [Flavobacterium sp.]|jgi:uncharacterized membrane protein